MKFNCYLEFRNIREPSKRMRVRFVMRAKGSENIQNKLEKSGRASAFFGWNLVKWGSNREFERDHEVLDCVCTYSKSRGFGGTFLTSPIWENKKGLAA